jgi:flagellar biosynthetic protein FliS
MSHHPASSYQQAAAQGASAIGQIVLLYDTILRDLGRALAALDAGNVETRVAQLNHALTVIAYLQSVLDHERGGEAAKRFEKFYVVTRGLIVQANFQPTRESVEKLIDLFSGVRQAWSQIEKREPVVPSLVSVPFSSNEAPVPRASNFAVDEIEEPQLHWSV